MLTLRKNLITAVSSLLVAAGPFCASPALARLPNDTYFGEQWHLAKIGAPRAWDSSLGFEGMPIAIIDSGVDTDHPDLKDNIWRNVKEISGNGVDDDNNGYVDDVRGWDFVDNDNDPQPDVTGEFSLLGANHGTIDAGIAAARADNGRGIAGVSWQSAIMPLRTLDSNGAGDPQKVVEAVEYAVHNGAKVINLSFAGPSYSRELAIALRRAYDAGVFVVAATGNAPENGEAVDLDRRPLYPVCFDLDADENFVYGVAATDEDDRRAAFSNYGAGCTDISAPGSRMLSTQFHVAGHPQFGQAYGGFYNGTSLAAAEVSGVVALLKALDPNLTPKQIMNVLTASAKKIDDQNPGYFGKLGRGRIDAAAAVRAVAALHKESEPTVQTATLLPANHDGRLVIAAAGAGRAPEVRMFTGDGSYVRSFMAFPESFRGGVSVATARFDGSSRKTIVAAAGPGGAPHVRIFDVNARPIGSFFAYDERFRGGVSVAVGDIDGDGRDEIVTGAGPGGGPHVRIFAPNGRAIGGFFAYDQKSRSGVQVALGDVDGDGRAEIMTVQPGGSSAKAWTGKGVLVSTVAVAGKARDIAATDADGDGKSEIVIRTADRAGSIAIAYALTGTHVFELDAASLQPQSGLATTGAPRKLPQGLAFGGLAGASPEVAVVTRSGAPFRFSAFDFGFKGGVSAAIAE